MRVQEETTGLSEAKLDPDLVVLKLFVAHFQGIPSGGDANEPYITLAISLVPSFSLSLWYMGGPQGSGYAFEVDHAEGGNKGAIVVQFTDPDRPEAMIFTLANILQSSRPVRLKQQL